jgi:hypothetical protein
VDEFWSEWLHASFKFGLGRPFFIDKQNSINYGGLVSRLYIFASLDGDV